MISTQLDDRLDAVALFVVGLVPDMRDQVMADLFHTTLHEYTCERPDASASDVLELTQQFMMSLDGRLRQIEERVPVA